MDLHDLDQDLFEKLLRVAGQQSLMGYAEADFVMETDKTFYNLPYGFSQFLQLEYRINGYPHRCLRSKPYYDQDWGVDILTPERGLRILPAPTLTTSGTSETWTLCYLRSPSPLHYATATAVGDNSLTSGIPPTDGGEVHLIDDFYNGVELRIVSSGNGAHPQVRVVDEYKVQNQRGTFFLREAWNPKPTGVVIYEVCPTLPQKLDRIYALWIAIAELHRREKHEKAANLQKDVLNPKWSSCINYFAQKTMDRGPARAHPLRDEDMIPGEGVPY